jgi:hypothetical protein
MRVVALLVLCAAKQDAESPVTQVVELLADLKAKIELDGKTEQGLYDKYSCWCEETTARKASAIEDGKSQIEQLSHDILELKAKQGSDSATLSKLNKDIAQTKEAIAQAEALRGKEHEEYKQEKAELEQGIEQLQKAIQVLGDGTAFESKEKERWNSALEETKILTVAAGVRNALRLYTRKDKDMAMGQDLSPVKSFLGNPTAWVQQKASVQAPHNEEYTPQSSVIQGILKQMYDDFTTNLSDLNTEEGTKTTDYESLMSSKRTDLDLLSSSLTSKSSSSADDGKSLADSQLAREEAEEQLTADEEFFATMKQGCKDQANQWAQRSRVRTNELSAINQAIDILSSDAATGTFNASASTFVQVSESARSPRTKVYNELKKAATKSKSMRLAALASRVYTTEAGHFDEVIKSIDDMVALLTKEQKDDIAHRDYCDEENGAAEAKLERLNYDLKSLDNKLQRMNNQKAELQDSQNKTDQAILDVENQIAEAQADRNQSFRAFQQAMKDDGDAIELVGKAIEVLASFYPSSFVQTSSRTSEEPNPDNEPEKLGAYEGKQSQGGGIVSILEMIKEDTENEMKVATEEENAAQKSYETLRFESVGAIKAMQKKKSTLMQQEAALDVHIANAEKVHYDTEDSKNSTEDYVADLKPNCDWVSSTFDTRKEQRDSEIEGLLSAKSILNGAGYDETAAMSAVATKSTSAKVSTPPQQGGWQDPKKLDATVDQELDELDADALHFGKTVFLQRRARRVQ